RLLLTRASARRPAAGYVCHDGGGRRRPPQQERKSLGSEPHSPRGLVPEQLHCRWWAPHPPELRSHGGPPPTARPSWASPGSPPPTPAHPCRAAHGPSGRGVPLRAVGIEAVSP